VKLKSEVIDTVKVYAPTMRGGLLKNAKVISFEEYDIMTNLAKDERISSILKLLREQVDDSRTWLSLHTNRKQKRGFWGMYKKHGTQFGLSNERTLATQAG